MASEELILNATWVEKYPSIGNGKIAMQERIYSLGCMVGCDVRILPSPQTVSGCRIKYDMFDIVGMNMKHVSLYDNV